MMMRRVPTLAVVCFFALSCLVPTLARPPDDDSSDRAITEPIPLDLENRVPYEGYGDVTILEDGSVLIGVGELVWETECGEQWASTTAETFVFEFDTAGLSLVESDGEFFLDRNGRHIAARGLSSEEVSITALEGAEPVKDAEASEDAPGHYSVFSVSGDMTLDYDASSGALEMSIDGEEDAPRTFTMRARVLPAARSAVEISADADNDAEPPAKAIEAKCSAECSDGSNCNINCPRKKAAMCYCKDGVPVCKCTGIPKDADLG